MSADTEKARKKSDYEFYKEHGICVNCRHEKAGKPSAGDAPRIILTVKNPIESLQAKSISSI